MDALARPRSRAHLAAAPLHRRGGSRAGDPARRPAALPTAPRCSSRSWATRASRWPRSVTATRSSGRHGFATRPVPGDDRARRRRDDQPVPGHAPSTTSATPSCPDERRPGPRRCSPRDGYGNSFADADWWHGLVGDLAWFVANHGFDVRRSASRLARGVGTRRRRRRVRPSSLARDPLVVPVEARNVTAVPPPPRPDVLPSPPEPPRAQTLPRSRSCRPPPRHRHPGADVGGGCRPCLPACWSRSSRPRTPAVGGSSAGVSTGRVRCGTAIGSSRGTGSCVTSAGPTPPRSHQNRIGIATGSRVTLKASPFTVS